VRVAGNAKTRTVRLGFGEWAGLPKQEHRGAGGWDCKNRDSKVRICENEHLGAHFHKSESWVMGGPAETGTSECGWLGLQKWEQ